METMIPQARMDSPITVLPEALKGLYAVNKAISRTSLPEGLLELCSLRASQINGCGVCAVQHPKIARKLGESDDRIFAVAAWREAPYFTAAERAALALTESLTRIADTADAVPDELWDECSEHFDSEELAGLVLSIAMINVWNRINVATRQVAGVEW